MKANPKCPRCGAEVMRAWEQLSDEEQEVVKRLPDSAAYVEGERRATHRWCTRCWYEESEDGGTVT